MLGQTNAPNCAQFSKFKRHVFEGHRAAIISLKLREFGELEA
jgi:hypothetical protein